MDRREALKLTTALLGGTLAGSQVFLSGCRSKTGSSDLITNEDIKLLDEIGETILPETESSPGAKAAEIGFFMKKIVVDCYTKSEQKMFVEGIKEIQDRAQREYGKIVLELTNAERFDFVVKLDEEARAEQDEQTDVPHYFTLMKQLTLWGYFTSEPGCTQALLYIQTPGRFEGCVSYQSGEKAWA